MAVETLVAGMRVGEYQLESPLGAGAFGVVWKARHNTWADQYVAVKIPKDRQLARQIANEGAVIHGLRHPNIVAARGLDPYADPPYLLMEFVNGHDLGKLISQRELRLDEVESIFRQILIALDHAHKNGVIHRDIKPPNVLLQTDETSPAGWLVKLSDFGLGMGAADSQTDSLLRSSLRMSMEGAKFAGTIAYIAPEVRDGQQATTQSDLYAAGLVLFEMATGRLPAGADRLSLRRKDAPAWMEDVFQRCYVSVEHRFQTAEQILRAMPRTSSANARGAASEPAAVAQVARRTRAPVSDSGEETLAVGAAGRTAVRQANCPRCKHPTQEDDNFCEQCGQALKEVKRCKRCGGFAANDDRFCMYCGLQLAPGRR